MNLNLLIKVGLIMIYSSITELLFVVVTLYSGLISPSSLSSIARYLAEDSITFAPLIAALGVSVFIISKFHKRELKKPQDEESSYEADKSKLGKCIAYFSMFLLISAGLSLSYISNFSSGEIMMAPMFFLILLMPLFIIVHIIGLLLMLLTGTK